MRTNAAILVLLIIASYSCKKGSEDQQNFTGFESLESSFSNITFSNTLQHDVSTNSNLLDFDYFYNGAGVGVGDINNDGLPDIFFAGNQEKNHLYLNKGNFKFEDISDKANINQGKKWSNGVAFADVNNDGWVDIYVSQGGPFDRANRSNLLYINNRNNTFTESALKYRVADQGISTQSAFFDYDKDGDLDLIVMNESELYGHDPISFHRKLLENPGKYDVSYSHFYRNDGENYTDISIEAGITKPSFGLGLVVSDINEDGWLDIYVANDYYLPDNVYINRKNGTFSDRSNVHLSQMSFFGMGADIADVNNDTHQDIAVLDMASKDHIRSKTLMASMNVEAFDLLTQKLNYPHQYMFNSLQLNDGNGRYKNVAQLSGLAKTDWSWAILMEDFDLDGLKDVFVSNGYRRYALDNDFKNKVVAEKQKYNGNVPLSVKEKLYNEMPSEPLPNLLYKNKGELSFSEVGSKWGMQLPSFSNGSATADFDNDGDLDIVISNIDDVATLYRNTAVEANAGNYLKVVTDEEFATAEIKIGTHSQLVEIKRIRGYMSSCEPVAAFGVGKNEVIDDLIVTFLDGTVFQRKNVRVNQTLLIKKAEAGREEPVGAVKSLFRPVSPIAKNLTYSHQENNYNDFAKEVLLPQKQSTLGPGVGSGDLNGDGLDDLVVTGAKGQKTKIFIQTNGSWLEAACTPCEGDKESEGIDVLIFDADSDGNQDVYIVNGGNEWIHESPEYADRLYLNDGNGDFTDGTSKLPLLPSESGGTAAAIDFDGDGDQDLILGNRIVAQNYPIAASSYILENVDGRFQNVTSTVAADLADFGIVNDVTVSDIDQDGDVDFIAVGEWTGIGLFINKDGNFTLDKTNSLLNLTGWWYSIHETDVNNDGLPDYIAGNIGSNIKHKASAESPFKVYARDFDNSGTLDVVLSNKYKDNYVPSRGRECSSQQMPFIVDKFPSYQQFASASLVDVYGDENIEDSYQKEVTEFKSLILLNNGNGEFETKELPSQAQIFPLLDATFEDFNGDGYMDVLIAGCIYNTEVETPRLDAGNGLVLLSNQIDGYHTNSEDQNLKIYMPGNVKRVLSTHTASESLIIGLKNNGPLSIFSFNLKSEL